MKKISIILMIAAVLLSACEINLTEEQVPDLEGTSWSMVNLNSKEALPSSPVWMAIEGGEVNGNGGCNHFGGNVSYDNDGNIEFGPLFMTEMFCVKHGSSDQEYEFFEALNAAKTYDEVGGKLRMLNEAGEVVLEFSKHTSTEE